MEPSQKSLSHNGFEENHILVISKFNRKYTLSILPSHTISTTHGKLHHHHQCLTPSIWGRWVRMNDLHCPRSFVKSFAPLNVSPIDSMSFFTLSVHRSLGLPLFLSLSNLACSALCGIWSIDILSTSYY